MLNQKIMSPFIRELKQQRWRRLPKRHFKSGFALLQTLSHLFQLVQLVKCWQILPEQNSKTPYQTSGKEKESPCLVFTSSTQREIRHFHVVVVQWRQRNVQKKWCTCKIVVLPNLKLLLFLPFSLLKLPIVYISAESKHFKGLCQSSQFWTSQNYSLFVFRACDFIRSYKATDKINLKFNYQAEQFSIFLEFFFIPSIFCI